MLTQQIDSHHQKTPFWVHVPAPKPKIAQALLPSIQQTLATPNPTAIPVTTTLLKMTETTQTNIQTPTKTSL